MINTAGPSIQLFTPLSNGLNFVENITPYKSDYRSSKRLYGGYWKASWIFRDLPSIYVRNFFNSRLAYHVKQKSGAILGWEGLIWEMEHTDYGVTRRMSLADVRNAVKCTYTDTADDVRKSTSWYKNDRSIDLYGEIQEIVFLDNVTASTAQAYAQTILAEQSFPYPNIVSVRNVEQERDSFLKVSAVGYSFTMNYKYLSIGAGVDQISDFVSNVIATDCPQVSEARIDTNNVTADIPQNEVRAWDWLMTLSEIGDGTTPFHIFVGPNRKVTYQAVNNQPTMHWFGQKITTSIGAKSNASKWALQPGVIRDHTWIRKPLPAEMFLDDVRDSLVTEIEVGEQYPIPLLKTEHWLESEFLSALERERYK